MLSQLDFSLSLSPSITRTHKRKKRNCYSRVSQNAFRAARKSATTCFEEREINWHFFLLLPPPLLHNKSPCNWLRGVADRLRCKTKRGPGINRYIRLFVRLLDPREETVRLSARIEGLTDLEVAERSTLLRNLWESARIWKSLYCRSTR